VVNPSSGPAWTSAPTDALRSGLPGADVVELSPEDDLDDLLCADDLLAVGAAGGDGTLSAVAVIAADRDVPFVPVPAGTLNHLARDLGLDTVDDTVAAVRAGTVIHMDLGVAGEHCFVNTLSLGGYTQIVDARERLESSIGKWPALLGALVTELPVRPCRLRPALAGGPRRRSPRRAAGHRRAALLPAALRDRRADGPAGVMSRLRGADRRQPHHPLAGRAAPPGRRRRDARWSGRARGVQAPTRPPGGGAALRAR